VVEAAIFFMYTRVPFDVSGKDESTFTVASFSNPSFSFDIMELYVLADFLDIQELMELLQELYFNTGIMFQQVFSEVPC
jgi:hypothetical protein